MYAVHVVFTYDNRTKELNKEFYNISFSGRASENMLVEMVVSVGFGVITLLWTRYLVKNTSQNVLDSMILYVEEKLSSDSMINAAHKVGESFGDGLKGSVQDMVGGGGGGELSIGGIIGQIVRSYLPQISNPQQKTYKGEDERYKRVI